MLAPTVRALATFSRGPDGARPLRLARRLARRLALSVTRSSSSPSASSGHTVDGGEELLDAGDVAEIFHLALVEVVVVLVVVPVVGHGVDGELTPRHEDLADLVRTMPRNWPKVLPFSVTYQRRCSLSSGGRTASRSAFFSPSAKGVPPASS